MYEKQCSVTNSVQTCSCKKPVKLLVTITVYLHFDTFISTVVKAVVPWYMYGCPETSCMYTF